ncbi:MAG: hypothetical protein Fur006_22140 [Coleofasciculaceae cyanobacterium]
MEFGYIYALQNKSLGVHHIKIGRTMRKPELRAKELYASGVPEPFDVAFACQVADCVVAEKKIHERLKAYRSNQDREFFIITIEVARSVIFNVCRQINDSSGYLVENPVVIDSRELDESDQFSDDSGSENLSGVHWFKSLDDLLKLRLSPPGISSLTDEQKQRIEVISAIFENVYSKNAEDWAKDFSRDINPEIEISVWENIAKAFLKIDQVKYLSDEQKKEAFYLLLMRSMMSVSKVLEGYKLSTLSKRAVKEILRGYEARPVMMVVGHHP